jgi:hypothetical protein
MCGAERAYVRSVWGERERAKAAGEYPTSLVGIKMRYAPWIVYNHRARAHDPPSSLFGTSIVTPPSVIPATPTPAV